jgi:hypothetical protein
VFFTEAEADADTAAPTAGVTVRIITGVPRSPDTSTP